MQWRTVDQAKEHADINNWNLVFSVVSNKKSAAIAVLIDGEIKWLTDPKARDSGGGVLLLKNITHFMPWPDDPIL